MNTRTPREREIQAARKADEDRQYAAAQRQRKAKADAIGELRKRVADGVPGASEELKRYLSECAGG